MKKTLLFILTLTMILGTFQGAAAAKSNQTVATAVVYWGTLYVSSSVKIYINDTEVEFDVNPIIKGGRVFVPVRKIFELFGYVVTWDEPTQSITAKKDETVFNLAVDSSTMFVNGNPVALDAAPFVIDSRVLVPARNIAETFGCTVKWIPATKSVKIYTDVELASKKPQLTSSEIAEMVSPAVFFIEVYNANGYGLSTGSGFFIDSDGIAVTNYHVIEGSSSAYITTTTGGLHKVERVIGYNRQFDIAVIKVSKENLYGTPVYGFTSLSVANSDNIKSGQKIYALGSPYGLQNTISDGIISNVKRDLDGMPCIQITAPISSGSSGGALINEFGEVLGINTAIVPGGQNLGFSVPINYLDVIDLSVEGVTYNEFASKDLNFNFGYVEWTMHPNEQKDFYFRAVGKPYGGTLKVKSSNEDVLTCEVVKGPDNEYDYILRATSKSLGTATVTFYSDEDPYGISVDIEVCTVSLDDVL